LPCGPEICADWPARKAIGDLLHAWNNHVFEYFDVRHGAIILAALSVPFTYEALFSPDASATQQVA
jgi:hypothetical protein